jgi:hypothetical protein
MLSSMRNETPPPTYFHAMDSFNSLTNRLQIILDSVDLNQPNNSKAIPKILHIAVDKSFDELRQIASPFISENSCTITKEYLIYLIVHCFGETSLSNGKNLALLLRLIDCIVPHAKQLKLATLARKPTPELRIIASNLIDKCTDAHLQVIELFILPLVYHVIHFVNSGLKFPRKKSQKELYDNLPSSIHTLLPSPEAITTSTAPPVNPSLLKLIDALWTFEGSADMDTPKIPWWAFLDEAEPSCNYDGLSFR